MTERKPEKPILDSWRRTWDAAAQAMARYEYNATRNAARGEIDDDHWAETWDFSFDDVTRDRYRKMAEVAVRTHLHRRVSLSHPTPGWESSQ